MVIDLRSDFLGRPTPEMDKAMVKASSIRCSFGLREDSTQNHLEDLAAELSEKEDALFFPTCTKCNQSAIHIFCSAVEKFITEAQSHGPLSESVAPAALAGAMGLPIRGQRGFIDLKKMEESVTLGDDYVLTSALSF